MSIQTRKQKKTSAWSPSFAREGDSLWSIVHKFAAFNGFKGPRTRQILGINPNDTSCTSELEEDHRLFRVLDLGEAASATSFAKSYIPLPLLREFGAANVFSKKLRFCRRCIEIGYHSLIHQVNYVVCCPIHGIPLTTNCPSCCAEIVMSSSDSALKYAFACRCGRSHFSSGSGGGIRTIGTKLDTSAISSWIKWCQSWSGDLLYKELTPDCDVNPLRFSDKSFFAGLNLFWAIRPPQEWSTDWVAYEKVDQPIESRLVRSRKFGLADEDGMLHPSLEEKLYKTARAVVEEIISIVAIHHPDCDRRYPSVCPAYSAVNDWERFWAPSERVSVKLELIRAGFLFGLARVYARVAWVVSTWEGDRTKLSKITPSLAAHLLEFAMRSSIGQALVDAAGRTYDSSLAADVGSVRDGSLRMLLDVKKASVMTWASPRISMIEENLGRLFEMSCHD